MSGEKMPLPHRLTLSDRKQLTVIFVDEEGLYKSMVDAAMRWRKKFMSIGVPFLWLIDIICIIMKDTVWWF